MSDWTDRRDAHEARVDRLIAGHRERAARGIKHSVEDFLFDYYSFRPAQLRRWHPGHAVTLTGPRAEEYAGWRDYVRIGGGVRLDTAAIWARRRHTVDWVDELLTRLGERKPQFGCFGMHEWAMVYRLEPEQVRHPRVPLRFDPDRIARIVEETGVRCSHFDAFRFFTEPARPLNRLRLTRATQLDLEQPGCLHVGMDLYRWAYKLSPLVDSDLVADCFEFARDIRELDMRASPYDVREFGLAPVPVETPEGRAEYVRRQLDFSDRAVPLRARILAATAAVRSDMSDCAARVGGLA